jgi:uncharacterized protein
MEAYVLRVLEADNAWMLNKTLDEWFNLFLPRPFIPRDTALMPDHRVCLVVGPRQVGKSTLIWKYLSETGKPFLFLNCEEPALRQWLTSPALVWEDICKLVDSPVPLFFEEIQRLPEAGLFLKGLIDRRVGVPVFATGSSSFHLESKTRESLAGRAVRHQMLPLSLSEMTQHVKGPEISILRDLKNQMQKMLRYGGYPTVMLASSPERELAGLVESIIIRDASDRFRVRYPAAFRKVLELAASQIGNLCNFSEWSAHAGISNDTVSEYTHLLQETHIVRLVRPFVGGKRAEITSTPKVYFVDNGIRNVVFGGFQPVDKRPDRGALWENFAFTEIYKSINPVLDSIGYWRSKGGAEVDFIIQHQGRMVACEIKAGALRGKIPRASRSFIDAYGPELFIAVSGDSTPSMYIDKTEVRFIQLFELGKTIREWIEG